MLARSFFRLGVVLVGSVVGWLGCASTTPHSHIAQQRGEVALASATAAPFARISRPIGDDNIEQVGPRWEALPGGFARAVAVSSGLSRVVFGNEAGVHVYDLANGKRGGGLAPCADLVRGGLYFHEGKLWVVCAQGVRVYDVNERRQLETPEVAAAPVTAAAWALGKLALAHRDGVVRVLDMKTRAITEIAVPGPPIDVKSLAMDREATRVAVAWIQGSIWWWRLDQPSVYHKLVRHERESDSVAFAPNGLFAEEGSPGLTTVWRLAANEEPKVASQLKNGPWIKRLLFTRDSKWLLRGGVDGLELAQVDGPKRLVLDSSGKVEDVAMDETGSVIASGDRVGRLRVFSVTMGR